jgi:hypothetical protein
MLISYLQLKGIVSLDLLRVCFYDLNGWLKKFFFLCFFKTLNPQAVILRFCLTKHALIIHSSYFTSHYCTVNCVFVNLL